MVEEKKKGEPRKRAEGTMGFGVSAFPIELWKEWDADCKKRFGDCRWIKIWNDHLRAKDYEFYAEVLQRIRVLEAKAIGSKKENANVVKTFKTELKS